MKPLSNIEIGECVLVINKENKLIYGPIEGFSHLKRNSSFSFLLINIEIDDHRYITTSLFISPNHLIFLANDKEVNNAIFASQLHSGDHIKYVYKNEIILGKIRNIYLTIEEGYCAPFTPSGTIIIDNVLIYLFGSNKNNENIHWILKLIERLVQWCGIEKFSQISIKENKLIYGPIEGFSHLKRNSSLSFLLINIEIDDHRYITTSLFISPNHLIF
ncbi:unnamed protein product [Rotaria sp. Silwood1]|nr:unnamed protein product [Rotaria sp. Silwood1]